MRYYSLRVKYPHNLKYQLMTNSFPFVDVHRVHTYIMWPLRMCIKRKGILRFCMVSCRITVHAAGTGKTWQVGCSNVSFEQTQLVSGYISFTRTNTVYRKHVFSTKQCCFLNWSCLSLASQYFIILYSLFFVSFTLSSNFKQKYHYVEKKLQN